MDHFLDLEIARKSNVIRKIIAFGLRIPRSFRGLCGGKRDFLRHPPVIVNSIPKSGTHLLLQVARSLPNTEYYGSFVAHSPSISLKPRSNEQLVRILSRVVPGEVLGAHLHYSPKVSQKIQSINAVHLLIIRDPVDILLSEGHYLAHMNAFHRMAREFRGLDEKESIALALHGSKKAPDLYPPFTKRLEPYFGWFDNEHTTVVRYEDLLNVDVRRPVLRRVVDVWCHRSKIGCLDRKNLIDRAESAIDPSKSHTVSNRMARGNIADHKKAVSDGLLELRLRMGYRS